VQVAELGLGPGPHDAELLSVIITEHPAQIDLVCIGLGLTMLNDFCRVLERCLSSDLKCSRESHMPILLRPRRRSSELGASAEEFRIVDT
jgi:hypothetical protein